jgi:hypothetical protein
MSEENSVEAKEWVLEPETEYRFELDPGTSLAIKVWDYLSRYFAVDRFTVSWCVDTQRFLEPSLQKASHISLDPNARLQSSPGKVVQSR